MSLINKVLRDLERKRSEDDAPARRSPLAEAELKPVRPVRRSLPSRPQLIRAALVLALVAVAAFAWVQWGGALRAPGKQAPVVQAKPPPAKTAAAPELKPVPTPAPKADAAAPPAGKVETAKIEAPPRPPGSPLKPAPAAVAPSPSVADVIVRKPREREVPVAVPRDAKPHPDAAKPSAPIVPKTPEKTVVAKAETPSVARPDTGTPGAVPAEPGGEPAAKPKTAAPPDTDKPRDRVPSAVPRDAQPVGKTVLEKKIKPLTPEERAESEYRLAADALQKRRSGEAESRLRAALAAQATHIKARELLAGLLLQSGRWREAQSQLEQGASLHPMHYPFAQLLARLYVDHGQEPRALELLEKARAAGSGDADYLAFLATLQQRAGRHDDATRDFNEALTLRPREGRWWLGLAISLEATEKWKESAEAYRRAAASGNLDHKLLQYSQQRLAVVKNK